MSMKARRTICYWMRLTGRVMTVTVPCGEVPIDNLL